MFYNLVRYLLFKLPPEIAHAVTLNLLKFIAPFYRISNKNSNSQQCLGLNFPNKIGLAAGLDKNGDYIKALSKLGFGFIEVGTVTPKAQPGNPKPRLFRLPQAEALINRMGFNNKGVDYLINNIKRSRFKGILGINIGKNFSTDINHALDDYLTCLRKVYPYASYIAINISSPNTPGLRDLQYGDYLDQLLKNLKQEQIFQKQRFGKYVPLLVKIAPDLTDIEIKQIAETITKNNMDGVIATNTLLDKSSVASLSFGQEQGGLSGKPLTSIATHVIRELRKTLKPETVIIAVGGIMSAENALEKMEAGADLVQLYTGFIYHGPALIKQITERMNNVDK